MLRMLALLPLVSACVSPWAQEPSDSGDFGPVGDGRCTFGSPSYLFQNYLPCGGASCPIALGGTVLVEVNRAFFEEVWIVSDGAVTQEPEEADDVYLRATELGQGHVELHALRCEGREEEVFLPMIIDILPVETVRLRAQDEIFNTNPASSYVAYLTDRIGWHTSDEMIYVELIPPGAGVTAPPYVVDATLGLGAGTDPSIHFFHHNAFYVTEPGTHDIVVEADSFGSRAFEVHVYDHVDRVEARVIKTPNRVGDIGNVCFYAFAEDYELGLDGSFYKFGFTGALGEIYLQQTNCRDFKVTVPGTAIVNVEIDGVTRSVEFPIAP